MASNLAPCGNLAALKVAQDLDKNVEVFLLTAIN
jgi:hypothetical protein